MKFRTADRSISIIIVTAVVILVAGILLIFSYKSIFLLVISLIFILLIAASYLFAPSFYQILKNDLIIHTNYGRKKFSNIKDCRFLSEKMPFTLRLFGNGGVFAGTGIFWNKKYGVFRVYVTTGDISKMLLLDTDNGKVLISPANTRSFLDHWKRYKGDG